MKASFKGKYEPHTSTAGAIATVVFNAGEIKLRGSLTDATVTNGPNLTGVALAVEKPGSFVIDYSVLKKDVRFQFMNTIRVSDKPLNFLYSHSWGEGRTMLDGSLVIDSANKASVNHVLGSNNCKFKYTYVHGGFTTFEPSYDWAKNSWDFAFSRRLYDDDVFRASYQASNKNLGVEWSRSSKLNGSFKITAVVNLAEQKKTPRLTAESTWDLEF